jgi:hypothetical protein
MSVDGAVKRKGRGLLEDADMTAGGGLRVMDRMIGELPTDDDAIIFFSAARTSWGVGSK